MYSQQGQYNSLPQEMQATQSLPGIHANVIELHQDLCQASEMLAKLSARVIGPEPQGVGNTPKEAREPSTAEYITNCHCAANRIQQQIDQLIQAVG